MKEVATVFVDVGDEVEVPPEGTLSRVLYSDAGIRLVVFAFDEGQELTDHAAGVPAIVQVMSGRLEVTLDGVVSELGPRSWVRMPAGLSHAVRALEPSVMLLTLLKGASAASR